MDNFKYHIIILLLKALALLPLRVLYVFSDIICFFAHRVIKYRLKVVRKNLRNSFPEKTEEELRDIEKSFYRHFCDCIVETVKLLHISDAQLKRRITLNNTELINELASEGYPIFLFMGHYGNWEWVPALTLSLKKPDAMGALYRPLRNRVMNRVILTIRSRFKSECIPTNTAYRTLVGMKRKHPSFMIGFIADQRPLGVNIKHWTVFLNQPTSFASGGETIGDRLGARYVYVDIEHIKRGYYSLTFNRMEITSPNGEDFPYTRLFFRLFEERIKKTPAFWLWSHNRWKKRAPETEKEQ